MLKQDDINYKRTKAICSKCKSKNLSIIEISEAEQIWYQVDGVINREEGFMEPGNIVRVEGRCDECGHRWRFKCLQIDNLIVED